MVALPHMDRRSLLRAAGASAWGLFTERSAVASVARAVPLQDLLARSRHVVLSEPLDAYSVWEQVAERRHIVTYTRLRALELLAGKSPDQEELLVRTLGGRIGDLGELVHGEAVLTLGARSVVFMMPSQATLSVTAMAQGHYPLARDRAGAERLLRSPAATGLTRETGSAVARLSGMGIAEARNLLRSMVRR